MHVAKAMRESELRSSGFNPIVEDCFDPALKELCPKKNYVRQSYPSRRQLDS